jgi:hypothetical protein
MGVQCHRNAAAVVTCYLNVNFRVPPTLSSIFKPSALQILDHRRKQSFSTHNRPKAVIPKLSLRLRRWVRFDQAQASEIGDGA